MVSATMIHILTANIRYLSINTYVYFLPPGCSSRSPDTDARNLAEICVRYDAHVLQLAGYVCFYFICSLFGY